MAMEYIRKKFQQLSTQLDTSPDDEDSQHSISNKLWSSIKNVTPRKAIRAYSPAAGRAYGVIHSAVGQTYKISTASKLSRTDRVKYLLTRAISVTSEAAIHYQHKYYIRKRVLVYTAFLLLAYVTVDVVSSKASFNWAAQFVKTPSTSPLNVYFIHHPWRWALLTLVPLFVFTRFYHVKRIIAIEEEYEMKKLNTFAGEPKDTGDSLANEQVNEDEIPSSSTGNDDEQEKSPKVDDPKTKNVWHKMLVFMLLFIQQLIAPTIRLVIAGIIWHFGIIFFEWFALWMGHCENADFAARVNAIKSKPVCIAKGHNWVQSFNMSGHMFRLVYFNLVRVEELAFLFTSFNEFAQFGRYYLFERMRAQNFISDYQITFTPFHFGATMLLLYYGAITFLWDYMILQTVFVYHTMPQKLVGLVFALLAWSITYLILFAIPKLRLRVTKIRF